MAASSRQISSRDKYLDNISERILSGKNRPRTSGFNDMIDDGIVLPTLITQNKEKGFKLQTGLQKIAWVSYSYSILNIFESIFEKRPYPTGGRLKRTIHRFRKDVSHPLSQKQLSNSGHPCVKTAHYLVTDIYI
jgi:hypothetical protein